MKKILFVALIALATLGFGRGEPSVPQNSHGVIADRSVVDFDPVALVIAEQDADATSSETTSWKTLVLVALLLAGLVALGGKNRPIQLGLSKGERRTPSGSKVIETSDGTRVTEVGNGDMVEKNAAAWGDSPTAVPLNPSCTGSIDVSDEDGPAGVRSNKIDLT